MAKTKTAPKLTYTQKRANDLKAQGACTTCGIVKGSGTKADMKTATFSRAEKKELADAKPWVRRLAAAKKLSACYACGTLRGTGTKVSTNGKVHAEAPETPKVIRKARKQAEQAIVTAEIAEAVAGANEAMESEVPVTA